MPAPSCSPVLLALLLLAAPAAAQERTTFDRRKHLPGWEEVFYSEWSALHDLDAWAELDGRRMTAAELAQVVEKWRRELARVEAEVEALRADPPRLHLFRLERELERHPMLGDLPFVRDESSPPLVLLVRATEGDDGEPAADPRIAEEARERLLPLVQHFERTYAGPLSLERNRDLGATPVVVLASRAEMRSFWERDPQPPHYRSDCAYDTDLFAPVVYAGRGDLAEPQARSSARHALAHLLVNAHCSTRIPELEQSWLGEGLAVHLAALADREDGGLAETGFDPAVVVAFVEDLADRDVRRYGYYPLDELSRVPATASLRERVSFLVEKDGGPEEVGDRATSMVLRELSLVFDWLHQEPRRERFLAWLGEVLRGERPPIGIPAALGYERPVDADRAFLEEVVSAYRELVPERPLRSGLVERVAAELAAARGRARPASEETEPPPAADGGPPDPETALARALYAARAGRASLALAALEDALPAAEGEDAARLARERERVLAWVRLRDAWLERLRESGEELRFERAGRKFRAPIARIEDGVVTFAPNRTNAREIAVEELDPYELAKRMGDVDGLDAPAWARWYPYVLAGDGRGARSLASDGAPEAAALLADAEEEDFEELMRRGERLVELDVLLVEGPPEDPASARAVLERLEAVLARGGGPRAPAERLAEVRALAERAWSLVYEEEGAAALLAGELEGLPGGRVRLTYDFEGGDELADFEPVPFDAFGNLPALEAPTDGFRQGEGELVGIGSQAYRHALPFRAPLVVRWRFRIVDEVFSDEQDVLFIVTICDDGGRRRVAALNNVDLIVHGDQNVTVEAADRGLDIDHAFAMELHCDGETASLWRDGSMVSETSAQGAARGFLHLVLHSDWRVHLEHLEIEGALDEDELESASAEWVGRKLEALR